MAPASEKKVEKAALHGQDQGAWLDEVQDYYESAYALTTRPSRGRSESVELAQYFIVSELANAALRERHGETRQQHTSKMAHALRVFRNAFCESGHQHSNALTELAVSFRNSPSIKQALRAHGTRFIGLAYEKLLECSPMSDGPGQTRGREKFRKVNGCYYTPPHIVRHMVKNAIAEVGRKPDQSSLELRVCDPAMGSGFFLLEMLAAITNKSLSEEKNPKTISRKKWLAERIAASCLFGADIDRRAVAITRLLLAIETDASIESQKKINEHLIEGNSLTSAPVAFQKPILWDSAFPSVFSKGGFDIVIGNPPYNVLDRNAQEFVVQGEKREKGKQNLASLFILLGTRIVRSGGILTYIVPRNLISDKSLSETRKLVFTGPVYTTQIEVFPKEPNYARAFPSVAVPAMIFLGRKTERKPSQLHVVKYSNGSDLTAEFSYVLSSSDLDSFLLRYDAIPIVPPRQFALLKKTNKLSGTIRSTFGSVHQGEINVSVYKKLIKPPDSSKYLLVEGKSIGITSIRKPLKTVDVSSKQLPSSKLEKLKLTRVVMQGINGIDDKRRIISNVAKGTFCAHSTNYLKVENEEWAYLCNAVMNSTYIEFMFRCFSSNNNINSYEIERIPFPTRDQIGRNGKKLSELGKSISKASEEEIAAIRSKIDSILEKLIS